MFRGWQSRLAESKADAEELVWCSLSRGADGHFTQEEAGRLRWRTTAVITVIGPTVDLIVRVVDKPK